jgi:hypothetical protein
MSNLIKNRILSIPFLKSLFFIQNEWHQHGVFLHTLRVTYYTVKAKDLKLISAALLHDIIDNKLNLKEENDLVAVFKFYSTLV